MLLSSRKAPSGHDAVADAKLQSLSVSGRILNYFFFLLFLVFLVCAFASLCIYVNAAIHNQIPYDELVPSALNSLISAFMFGVFAAVFFISASVFRDVSRGESPFSEKQARRIRFISWLLFIYAIVDSFAPKGVVVAAGNIDTDVLVARFETEYTAINVGMFVSAIIFYFLSSVFKYGVELQELSDDVI